MSEPKKPTCRECVHASRKRLSELAEAGTGYSQQTEGSK